MILVTRNRTRELEKQLAQIRVSWAVDRAELERLREKVCTCGHGALEPAFHIVNQCPVAIEDPGVIDLSDGS